MIWVLLIWILPIVTWSDDLHIQCHGKTFNPITDICWKCMFPITIGSVTAKNNDLPDPENPKNSLCFCRNKYLPKVGLTFGIWEPIGLIDVTRTPYCLVSLGGMRLPIKDSSEGNIDTPISEQGGSFHYVHYYRLPILQWIAKELFQGSCETNTGYGNNYLSELDPTWRNSKLAMLVYPETAFFSDPANILATHMACAIDGLKANTGLPIDNTYWCAGRQGFMYPLSGKIAEQVSILQASTLLAERIIFKQYRSRQIMDYTANNLCRATTNGFLPKSRYRYQVSYPKANVCQAFGHSTWPWETEYTHFSQEDEVAYVIWRKRNCCNY